MATPSVLSPLIAAGIVVTIRADGRLAVRPMMRITPTIDAYLRGHRDELVAALSVDAPTAPTSTSPAPIRVPTLKERDRALPDGLKPSYCPSCRGRTVVVSPAAAHLRCARCAPASHSRRQESAW
jgi:hypothetical protein